MSHAKRVTKDNRKNPEYQVVVVIRQMQTGQNKKSKIKQKMSSISDLKRPMGPQNTEQFELYHVVAR